MRQSSAGGSAWRRRGPAAALSTSSGAGPGRGPPHPRRTTPEAQAQPIGEQAKVAPGSVGGSSAPTGGPSTGVHVAPPSTVSNQPWPCSSVVIASANGPPVTTSATPGGSAWTMTWPPASMRMPAARPPRRPLTGSSRCAGPCALGGADTLVSPSAGRRIQPRTAPSSSRQKSTSTMRCGTSFCGAGTAGKAAPASAGSAGSTRITCTPSGTGSGAVPRASRRHPPPSPS